jgi:hypothetical protein
MGVYRFGPLGRMLSIELPSDGFDDTLDELGAVHQALSGLRTKDVFGHKRTFVIPLEGLAPSVVSWFEMAFRGSLGAPLYLLDEYRVNRLSGACSSTLSAWSPYTAFTASVGTFTATTTAVEFLPAPGGPSLAPAKALTWVATAAGLLTCQPTTYTPVKAGEVVTFSAYVPSGTVTLELVPFAKTTLTAGAPVTGTVSVAGTPLRRYVTYIVPSDGSVVAVRPQVRIAAAGTAVLLALQLEQGAVPSQWVQGSGVPKVLVGALSSHRRRVGGYLDGSAQLMEV